MIWTDKKGVKHSDYYWACIPCALCMSCKHFITFGNLQPICAAFPGGIPEDVWSGAMMHTKPIKGDHGYQYEEEESETDDTDLPELLIDDDDEGYLMQK